MFRTMPRTVVVVATLALALDLGGWAARAQELAQGVAPGGGIANSTGIGSGLGGVVGGTGPIYPNGTTVPPLAPPPPPGGAGSAGGAGAPAGPPPAASIAPPASTLQPQAPYGATTHRRPATVPLRLPDAAPGDMSFLKGCWRTDVFPYAHRKALSTWCFNGEGAGKVLYTRVDQADFFCHAQAEASYGSQQLHLHSVTMSCSDGSELDIGDLDCHRSAAGEAQCIGKAPAPAPAESWTVRLYRVR